MQANKIFIDLYSTSGGKMPHTEYEKYYLKNNIVFILLLDSGIYCQVARQKMFDMNLHCGCFLESIPQETPYQVEKKAEQLINKFKLKQVSPAVFQYIEKKKEQERVRKALNYAEKLIARG